MVQVSYPGVYVEEVSSGVRPVADAGTSVAAFIGVAEKGPIGEAVKVFNFTEYQNLYGGFLDGLYLSHAVFQFFNNGGTQCYVVRVTGANTMTADIVLKDRGKTPQESLGIEAKSPGVWGNRLAIVISDGTNDPGNEFNLSVFWEHEPAPLETFKNLSMMAGAPNFVETATASSNFIRVMVNPAYQYADSGTSVGSAAPIGLTNTGKTRLRINVDGDGYREVDLEDAVGKAPGVDNLENSNKLAAAIQYVVTNLKPIRQSTHENAFKLFTCSVDNPPGTGALVLKSGTKSASSSVNVAPASEAEKDAAGLLKLGTLQGGKETLGAAVSRPRVNPDDNGAPIRYLVGDNAAPTNEVNSAHPGSDGDNSIADKLFIDAFKLLDGKDDVSLIAVPGIGSKNVVGAGMTYCSNRPLSDCFFIGDMRADDDSVEDAKAFRDGINPPNSYGAVYLPWVKAVDPTGRSAEPILLPPSGFVAGIYARTDARRGVWKAPAGIEASLGGAVGLKVNFTDVEQGNLNASPRNINVIRQFPSAGIVLWGTRTVTSDAEWSYIPVRRMAIFLRVSIYRGIQWAVFEPNDEGLWSDLRLNIGSFMMNLFRQGAFQGSSPSQAFFVKCDGETTTQADIDSGIVNVLVGFAPLKPAEFVVVKISQKAGNSA